MSSASSAYSSIELAAMQPNKASGCAHWCRLFLLRDVVVAVIHVPLFLDDLSCSYNPFLFPVFVHEVVRFVLRVKHYSSVSTGYQISQVKQLTHGHPIHDRVVCSRIIFVKYNTA